jgi:hypothetical protein
MGSGVRESGMNSEDQERLPKERPLATNRSVKLRLALVLSLLCFGLAVVTLVPWSASIPNHLGYYSVCSFAPVSTAMLLVLGLGILSYGLGRKREFEAFVVALVVLIGASGVWAYTEKLPISNLQLGIQVRGIVQIRGYYSPNSTEVVLNLTVHNPTDVDTPAFEIESFDFVINGTRLAGSYLFFRGYGGSGNYFGVRYILEGETVRAHQTNIYKDLILHILWGMTEFEGGDPSTVHSALNQSKFSLTLSGLIVIRTSYIKPPDIRPGPIIAVTPFNVSCTYP